jgi:Xaa-Pro aminopeptidase
MTTRLAAVLVFLGCGIVAAQPSAPSFTDVFPTEEFAARRARVMERIGGVAVLQGAPEMSAEVAFRQNNQFFYLTGLEVPRALLVIDGRSRRSTLFLATPRRECSNGPELGPGPEAAVITGIDAVVARDTFGAELAKLSGRPLSTAFRADPDHRNRVREHVGLRADRDRGDREAAARACD